MSLNDPAVVRREYASDSGLRTRAAVYGASEPGTLDVHDLVLGAVAERNPRRVLEVGCGWGELAARLERELGCEVTALDLSPHMVELSRRRGVAAQVGDVQELQFGRGEFDCAVAAWMLYHVPDLDRGLRELHRVLAPGGRLVATTNGRHHLEELWRLGGRDRAGEEPVFRGDNAEVLLRRYFSLVTVHAVEGIVVFPDYEAVRDYIRSSIRHKHLAAAVPPFEGPLRARRSVVVAVADKP